MSYSRHLSLSDEIIVLDGINGTGKSLLEPILASFIGVHYPYVNHIFDQLTILNDSKEITDDAFDTFIKGTADLSLYKIQISREVNLRPHDDTGILNHPFKWKVLKRLFLPDGNRASKEIEETKPAFSVMVHNLLGYSNGLWRAFEGRLKWIEMVRHPVYTLGHWLNYAHRYGKDSREFNLWIKHKQHHLPWYAKEWEEEFVSLNQTDQSIIALFKMQNLRDQMAAEVKSKNRSLIQIPFEYIAMHPHDQITLLENFLKRKPTNKMNWALNRQLCPRSQLSAGKGHSHYGFKKAIGQETESHIYSKKYKSIAETASPNGKKVLDDMIEKYERQWDVKKYIS